MARSLRIGLGTVSGALARAEAAGLDWPAVQVLTDDDLERQLYRRPAPLEPTRQRPAPDCAWIHAERRKPGVTLELLHLEYLEQHPTGYRYTQFCGLYRRWLQRRCSAEPLTRPARLDMRGQAAAAPGGRRA